VIYNPVSLLYKPYPLVPHQGKPKILQVGSGANKNIERLIEAVQDLSCELILIRQYDDSLDRKMRSAGIDCSWHFNLSQEDVVQLYVSSDLVFFASTYEGFGIPIIEAQAIGRPVITSNLASMPEVGGEGVCLVNPYDVQEIKASIQKIVSDEHYRKDLIQKGIENTARFQLDHIVQQYIDLYQEVYDAKK
jgi:glycosyltransferase involved in cell wall biosynthesis